MEKKVINIRKARQGDAVAVFRLVQEMHGESNLPMPDLDENRTMAWVVATIAGAQTFVADLSGRVVGTIALVPHQPPWSAQLVLSNAWLFVIPKFRREGTGRSLIKAACVASDELGAAMMINASGGGHAEWKDEFLSSEEGFVYGGGMFVRDSSG